MRHDSGETEMAERNENTTAGASRAAADPRPAGGPGKGDRAKEALAAARKVASGAAEQARSVAGQLAGDVREVAESLIDEQKERAAAHVGGVAEALRKTAAGLQDENEFVARYAARAADEIARFGESVRERGIGDIVADIDAFARRQPTLFLVGAVAAGFVVGRFMAASADRHRRDGDGEPGRRRRPESADRMAGGGPAGRGSGNGHASTRETL
jgi:hypothetical protein